MLNETGRPEHVWGPRGPPQYLLEHAVLVTRAELLLAGLLPDVHCARNVAINEAIADAGFTHDGDKYYVEVDNQTMTAKQMRQKWLRYGDVKGFILVICRTEARLKQLLHGAKQVLPVRNTALFTLFRWLEDTQIQKPWVDWKGQWTQL